MHTARLPRSSDAAAHAPRMELNSAVRWLSASSSSSLPSASPASSRASRAFSISSNCTRFCCSASHCRTTLANSSSFRRRTERAFRHLSMERCMTANWSEHSHSHSVNGTMHATPQPSLHARTHTHAHRHAHTPPPHTHKAGAPCLGSTRRHTSGTSLAARRRPCRVSRRRVPARARAPAGLPPPHPARRRRARQRPRPPQP